jgi:AcrR family transcriptional regulator
MRITAEEKTATRQRILTVSVDLFRSQGFEATTTRDIAVAASIATGTLFNYFATKEAIVADVAGEALAKAHANFARQTAEGDLAEELFALIAVELRQLKPLRTFILPLLETSLSPLANGLRLESTDPLRLEHLDLVMQILRRHGVTDCSTFAVQIYWSLYTGLLAFWAGDSSPKQEDTLALLDQSLAMFVAWLRPATSTPERLPPCP